MKFLSRVVWSEGMHLGPHHFQTQSRYFEDTLWFLNSNLRQEPWGFLHFSLDTEALSNGLAILSFASGILPDGLIFDVPDCDAAPEPAQLSELFALTDSEIILHLAIPPRQDQGLDCDLAGGASARYGAVQRTLRDDAIGLGESSVSFARKNLVLQGQAQISADTVSFPIARIFRDGKGGFASDPGFIPPCLRIGACEGLVLLLHRLAQAIEEKIVSTRNLRSGSGGFELGTSALDVANYWFLHALCSALPALREHLQDRRSHPEEVYRDLARLAGALSTFSLEATRDEIPAYRHRDLTATFKEMDSLIRRLPRDCGPVEHRNAAVPQSRPLHLRGRGQGRALPAARAMDPGRALSAHRLGHPAPDAEAGQSLLRRGCGQAGAARVAGPGADASSVPPAALNAQADMHYFSVSLSGACWQHILQTKQVGVYLPGDLGDATFDLTVIMEASQ